MDIKIQVTNPTRRSVTVTIPAATVAASEKEVIKGITRKADLPGFRPGKAPEAIVRQKYSKNIADEISQLLLAQGYDRIKEEKSFTVYTLADVQKDETTQGADVVIRYEVDVLPEFKTPDWQSIKIAKEVVTVTDAEVAEHLQKLLQQRARFEKTEAAAAKGDYVRLSYTGTVDGQAVKEVDAEAGPLGSSESSWEEAGSESEVVAVPAIAKAIIGLKAGDTAKAEQAYGADATREALRGKTVQYALTVSEVRCKEIPAVDEAFCKSVGVKDEADLRDQLRKGITGTKEQAAETARREKALDALITGLDLPLPQSAVDSVANGLFNEYLQLRIRNGTLKPEQFEAQREEIITESRKAAETKVRAQVVLVRIAEENGIDLTREEFTQAILREAYRTNVQPEKLAKDRNQLQVLRRDAVLNKALDLVLDGKAPEAVEKA